jgi:hypothetical protein
MFDKPHDGQSGDRLSRSRLADDGDRLAAVDRERELANRRDDAIRRRKFDGQLFDAKNGRRGNRQGPHGKRQGAALSVTSAVAANAAEMQNARGDAVNYRRVTLIVAVFVTPA